MALYSPAEIRQAIGEALDGTLQGGVSLPLGVFAPGVFEGQPLGAQQAGALQTAVARHRFDVVLGDKRTHPASPLGSFTSHTIEIQEVKVNIYSTLPTSVQKDARRAALQLIAKDCSKAVDVLRFPNNLTRTGDDVATGIVSGMMLGAGGNGRPSWEPLGEDWDALLARSHIVGAVVLEIAPETDRPDVAILLDDDGITPIRDDDGSGFVLIPA